MQSAEPGEERRRQAVDAFADWLAEVIDSDPALLRVGDVAGGAAVELDHAEHAEHADQAHLAGEFRRVLDFTASSCRGGSDRV